MLRETISYKFLTILEEIRNNTKSTLEKLGVTHGEFITLIYISEREGLTQAQLADISRKDRNVIGRHIDALEKIGFIQRRRGVTDRRSYSIFLTEKGKEIAESNENLIKNTEKKVVSSLSKEEVEILNSILNKIIK